MSLNLVTLLYLVASICFIQALKGLSHPTTSIRGNLFGMVGMAIAILTTAALIVQLLLARLQGSVRHGPARSSDAGRSRGTGRDPAHQRDIGGFLRGDVHRRIVVRGSLRPDRRMAR